MNGERPRATMNTGNRATALRAAKNWYNDLLLQQAKGEHLVQSPDFTKVAEELFKEDPARVNLDANSKTPFTAALIGCKAPTKLTKPSGVMPAMNLRLEIPESHRHAQQGATADDSAAARQLRV